MAVRLLEMHRVLKDTGSIYLHCDPTMSHSLKLLLDAIFGGKRFCNEIVWCYSNIGMHPKSRYPRKHDIIFYYAKGKNYTFNKQTYKHWKSGADANPCDWWVDITSFNGYMSPKNDKHCGYPTQKPRALLERVIQASSNPGDLVLDPFCGCATACVVAELLGRRWVGIDISKKAYDLVKQRLHEQVAIGSEQKPTLLGKVIHRKDIPTRSDQVRRSKNIKEILYGKQKGNCNGCGSHFQVQHFHVDHIIAKANGGQDTDNNLQLLCGHCNSIKGKREMKHLVAELKRRDYQVTPRRPT